jgi:hypothetical protein
VLYWAAFMRDTVGYLSRRRRPKRPVALQGRQTHDSFAYAGGEIMVRKLPVPSVASAPPLPAHLMAVPQSGPAVIPTSNVKEITPTMTNPNASALDGSETVTLFTEALSVPERDDQPAIPKTEQTPSTALALAAAKPQRRRRPCETADATLARPAGSRLSLAHHRARCTICNHPDRESIDVAFLHWQRPTAIAHEFQLADRRVLYRHAHALGLFHQRAAKSRRTLEFIMEQAESVTATADSIIRAVRAHSCLGEDGRWSEPRKEALITHKVCFEQAAELIDTPADQNVDLSPIPPTKLPKLIDTLFRRSTRLFASVF